MVAGVFSWKMIRAGPETVVNRLAWSPKAICIFSCVVAKISLGLWRIPMTFAERAGRLEEGQARQELSQIASA